MPKPIQISDKNPHTISASMKGLTIGKWMTTHLLPKATPVDEIYSQSKKNMKKIATEWRKIRKKEIEHSPTGQKILLEFYRMAANYSEAYWKLCNQSLVQGRGKKSELLKQRDQARKDFNYFSSKYLFMKERGKKSAGPLEKKLDALEIKVTKTRKQFEEMVKTKGKDNWHTKNVLLEHLETLQEYLSAEAENLARIKEEHPEFLETIKANTEIIDREFKENTRLIKSLREQL
jgi:hypothetical protein